jgi:cytochrome c oxidase subunit 1
VIAVGLPIIGYGLIFNLWLCALGGLITGGGIFGFVLEPPDDPDAPSHHDDHGEGHEGEHMSEIEEASHG